MTAARIIFAGSPEFSVPPLQTLIAGSHEVVAVLTQPDRPSGRGRKLVAGPVKQAALDAGIPVLQPQTLKDPAIREELAALKPDLMVVVAYGLLLPAEVLQLPARGCINLHASLLPRWRGAAPMQMAILHGDAETGVCVMQMDIGLDTGDVLASRSLSIGDHELASELHDRLSVLGADLLGEYLEAILSGSLPALAQPEDGITYAHRIKKADGLIDWTQSAIRIDRQIRAYNPWPAGQSLYQGELFKCLGVRLTNDQSAEAPGTLLGLSAAGLRVQTGDGVLALTQVQLAGRKAVAAADFVNAHNDTGLVLGV
jgi:methionyl-tRNA formyltransferase